jgi:hypothetical protein
MTPHGVRLQRRSAIAFEPCFYWSAYAQTIRFYARYGQANASRCHRATLEDRAGTLVPFNPTQLERCFQQYREEIEDIAGKKIRTGRFQADGTVLIRTLDLTTA